MNWRFWATISLGPMKAASMALKNLDANDQGPDDKVAQILHYAAAALEAIVNNQPLPPTPDFS